MQPYHIPPSQASPSINAELEAEFETWRESLSAFWRRNKAKAQKLGAVAGILARLASPGTPSDTKPPVQHTAAADWQQVQDKRRKDGTEQTTKKDTTAGGKELENTLLGEILTESYVKNALNPDYEMAVLVNELSGIYDRLKEVRGVQSILAEVLLEALELETYEQNKTKKWSDIKTQGFKAENAIKASARFDARKLHFGNPASLQPIGIEVHHWIPFKYADLFDNVTLEQLNKQTIPLSATTHAIVGAAIDKAVAGKTTKDQKKAAIINVLKRMGEFNGQKIVLSPTYFDYKEDRNFLPSSRAGKGVKIGVLRNIPNFKAHFGLSKELEFEVVNYF